MDLQLKNKIALVTGSTAAGKVVLLVIAALLPILNPLGSAPIFLATTTWCSTDMRQALARRIAVNGFTILLVSIFIGSHILAFFGISLPVVQVLSSLTNDAHRQIAR